MSNMNADNKELSKAYYIMNEHHVHRTKSSYWLLNSAAALFFSIALTQALSMFFIADFIHPLTSLMLITVDSFFGFYMLDMKKSMQEDEKKLADTFANTNQKLRELSEKICKEEFESTH